MLLFGFELLGNRFLL